MEIVIVALFFAVLTVAAWMSPTPTDPVDPTDVTDYLRVRDGQIVTDVLAQRNEGQR